MPLVSSRKQFIRVAEPPHFCGSRSTLNVAEVANTKNCFNRSVSYDFLKFKLAQLPALCDSVLIKVVYKCTYM